MAPNRRFVPGSAFELEVTEENLLTNKTKVKNKFSIFLLPQRAQRKSAKTH